MEPAFHGVLEGMHREGLSPVPFDSSAGGYRFRYPLTMQGVFLFAVFGIPLLVALCRKKPGDEFALYMFSLGFSAINLPILVECLRYQLLVTPEGITRRSPWGRQRSIAWSDVQEVYFSDNFWAFIIVGANGEKIRAPCYLAGIVTLIYLLEGVASSKCSASARKHFETIKDAARKVSEADSKASS